MHILASVFFEEYHQFVKPHLIGNVLHHRHIKHIRASGLADGKNLLSDFLIHCRTYNKNHPKGADFYYISFLKKFDYIRRSSYLRYNKDKHCGFVSIRLQLRLVGGDSNHSGLSGMVIS